MESGWNLGVATSFHPKSKAASFHWKLASMWKRQPWPYVLAQTRAAGGVVATRPVAVELDWQRGPQVLDQVVVTGFGGMAWWLGRVAVVSLEVKKPHVVYYEGDDTKVTINLAKKSYGPAKITEAARGSAEKVEFGWMLALPTEVAAAARAASAHD